MKIRNGFVSNSSSSSFIVKVDDFNYNTKQKERIITPEQEQFLVGNHWKYTHIRSPSSLLTIANYENGILDCDPKDGDANFFGANLGYWVTCNEDEVIDMLTKERIPFTASCHYGHYTVIFDGKEMYELQNYGNWAEMYGINKYDRYGKKIPKNAVTKITFVEKKDEEKD